MIKLRPATLSDARLLFDWRNDPSTYCQFRIAEPVTWAEHHAWLTMMLRNGSEILIAEKEREPIGVVRFRMTAEAWVNPPRPAWDISVTIDNKFRGQGLGYLVLRMATKENRLPLIAEIKRINTASVRIFERCGFIELGGNEEYVLYQKDAE